MDRGLAGYDLRHSFNLNYSYDLPFRASGWAGRLIEGWQTSGIIKIQSGIPFGPTTAFNPGDGLVQGGISGGPAYRPDLLPGYSNNPITGTSNGCGSIAKGTPVGTPELYFDPCAFSQPAVGLYGNLGRHTIIGPVFRDVDFSVLKSTKIRERQTLQFRAEGFNILNHPNFSNPLAVVFAANGTRLPNAGQITSTVGNSRQIQFGLKLIF